MIELDSPIFRGRFSRFLCGLTSNKVRIFCSLQEIEEFVDWIAENTTGKWAAHNNNGYYDFNFENYVDAVHFA